jgi:hypothetical protein
MAFKSHYTESFNYIHTHRSTQLLFLFYSYHVSDLPYTAVPPINPYGRIIISKPEKWSYNGFVEALYRASEFTNIESRYLNATSVKNHIADINNLTLHPEKKSLQ